MPLIGANGGLIGAARTSRRGAAVGVWTPNEQVVYQRQNAWIGDANFANVSLLLHMDGANNSTTFTDSSLNALTVTANGDAKISTAQSKFGGASAVFDGTGDYLTLAANTALNYSDGDFTAEAWIYLSALPALNNDNNRVGTILVYGSNGVTNQGYALYINTTTNALIFARPGTGTSAAGSFTWSLNTWYHIAFVRSGSANLLFVNGQSLTLTTNTFTPASLGSGELRVGAERLYAGYNHDFNGYIDDLRITKGVARYTANFTPPSAPFPDL